MLGNRIKKYRALILIAFLAGLTLFSVIKYITLQKENYYLYNNLKQIKKQIDSLEVQRQNLLQTIEKQNQENSIIKDTLKVSEDKLTKMEADFIQAKKTIEELNDSISSLKAEKVSLKDQSENLKAQLSQVSQEKDSLQAKLNSLEELKKTIREIKRKMREAKKELLKRNSTSLIGEGNRGFIVKNGKSTYHAKVIIEVKPTP
jgi:chromosome segregation ATPase